MKNEEKKEIKQTPVESNTIIQFLHTQKKKNYLHPKEQNTNLLAKIFCCPL